MNNTKVTDNSRASYPNSGIMVIAAGFVIAFLIILSPITVFADDITVSGNPGSLVVSSAVAGSEPDEVSNATTTYAVDIITDNKKITGAIDTAMPANTALKVTLSAPSGANSVGQISLSATAQDLVTGLINGTNQSGMSITYVFSATVDAGVIISSSKTVTLTITDSS